ncbi:MAG TPA: DUF177 domain-containing protein [Pyrinomonadaceae bacterium]|nr:DUF177 domain-containing protein [Pyrinomonadaceae bacterium]
MKYEVASLGESGKSFSHQYQPGELILEDERVRLIDPPPAANGRIRPDRDRTKVTGEFAANVEIDCDRCLKPVETAVKGSFTRQYITADEYDAQQAVELSEEDLDLSVYDGAVIDIDELLREELLLAAPDQVLCKAECKGICPTCGADLNAGECKCETTNVDPRWAALKEIANGD